MLLERLGPNLHERAMPLRRVLDAIATTLRGFWRPLAVDVGLPTGADKAAWLAQYIATTSAVLGRPCGRAVIDRASALCEKRAAVFDTSRAVLVHGDAHGWNTLEAGGGSFKFVDPEGLRSEPEHDLSVAMREYNRPLLAGDTTARLVRERAELLAARCGVDADAVWEWGFIERVSTGLANLREFNGNAGVGFLEVARALSLRRARPRPGVSGRPRAAMRDTQEERFGRDLAALSDTGRSEASRPARVTGSRLDCGVADT